MLLQINPICLCSPYMLVKRFGHVAHPQNKILETLATVATTPNIQQRMIQKRNGIVTICNVMFTN